MSRIHFVVRTSAGISCLVCEGILNGHNNLDQGQNYWPNSKIDLVHVHLLAVEDECYRFREGICVWR